jgi:hypothetical protein
VNSKPDRRPSRLLLALLVLMAAAQTAHYYPLLPATLASNCFRIGRRGSSLRCPYLLKVPNRECWLSGERCQETLDFIRDRMRWFADTTLAFLMGTFGSCFARISTRA